MSKEVVSEAHDCSPALATDRDDGPVRAFDNNIRYVPVGGKCQARAVDRDSVALVGQNGRLPGDARARSTVASDDELRRRMLHRASGIEDDIVACGTLPKVPWGLEELKEFPRDTTLIDTRDDTDHLDAHQAPFPPSTRAGAGGGGKDEEICPQRSSGGVRKAQPHHFVDRRPAASLALPQPGDAGRRFEN